MSFIPGMFPTGVSKFAPPIALTDDGDVAPSSGGGTATHTYNAQTSTGPDTWLKVSWDNSTTARTLSSATWGGVVVEIIFAYGYAGSDGAKLGCAFLYIRGAQPSGSIVLTFSGVTTDSQITKVSLTNMQSQVPVDTDFAESSVANSAQISLSNLASPGLGGIRLAIYVNKTDTTAISVWATEIADVDAGAFRHGCAFVLGDTAAAISPTGAAAATKIVAGISIR